MSQNAKQGVSLKMNMIMSVILTISSMLFPLITFPYISRVVGAEGIGKVTFATSVVTYFSMFAQLGIPTYGICACAKVRDNKQELSRVVHEILIINVITCIISYVALGISLCVIPRFLEEKLLFLVIGSTILLNTLGVEWLYKALEQYSYITIRSLIFKVIALVGLFCLVHSEQDYVIYGGISVFAIAASNVMNFINLRKYISISPIGNYHIKPHLKMVFIFFAMSIATTIYTNLDNVMLGFMKDDIEVGYYTVAVKMKLVLVGVVNSVSTVLLPRASYYVDKGFFEEFYNVTKRAMNFVIIIAVPSVLYFIVFAKESIFLLSGEGFGGAILSMQIIMPTLLFIAITNILGIQMMIPLGKEKIVLYSTIWGAIVDLIVNIIMIPRFGAAGASIGTVVAEFVVLMYQILATRDMSKKVLSNVRVPLLILANALAIASCIWVKQMPLNAFFTLAVSAICFFSVYLFILIVAKERVVLDVLDMILGKFKKNN